MRKLNANTKYQMKMVIAALMLSASVIAQTQTFYNVVDYGAVSGGKTKIDQAVSKAIDLASEHGGGTIFIPAGEWLTGPIHFKSNINIHLDAGCVLKFSDDFDDYLPMVKVRWQGTECVNFSPLFYGYRCENISITERGTIDGQGTKWWRYAEQLKAEYKKKGKIETTSKWQEMFKELNKNVIQPDIYNWTEANYMRPPFIQPYECKNVLIQGIKIINSPWWTVTPVYCEDVTIDNISIYNPPESMNTDGIDPDACKNVIISNCYISVGDDCIAVKSGRDEDGRRVGKACENITITNCVMLRGHGGVSLGSEMSGGIKNVVVSNCVFDGTNKGIRIKTQRGRGASIEDARFSNIVMRNITKEAITLDMSYNEIPAEPVSEKTPKFKNIHISNITGINCGQAGLINGLEEMPVEYVTLNDIDIQAEKGFEVFNAENIEFTNIRLSVNKGSVLTAENVDGLEIGNIKPLSPPEKSLIKFNNVKNARIYNSNPGKSVKIFLEVSGSASEGIIVKNNDFRFVQKVLNISPEVDKKQIVIE